MSRGRRTGGDTRPGHHNPVGGQVRIIGGKWRGRRLDVVDRRSLRPTPDRVRETLFNWLAPVLPGARCLDLFAGSGILGFEAESRGAETVYLIENDPRAARALRGVAERLEATASSVFESDAFQWLTRASSDSAWAMPYDIVFIDPPYTSDWAVKTLRKLAAESLVHRDSLVYVESAEALDPKSLPPGWDLYRAKTAGQVRYHLVSCALT